MNSTQKSFLVDKTGHIEDKFEDNIPYSPSSPLSDYDVTTFSRSYVHGGALQTGFTDWPYVTECGGMHQSGSHSQRSTIQGIEEVFASTLSYEDGRSHEDLFPHSRESIDSWPLVAHELPPPPYTNEASNDDFLTSDLLDSKESPVGQTSIGTTGDLPLPYDLFASTNAPQYGDAKFVSKPNFKRNPVSVPVSQKFLYPQTQKGRTSVLLGRPVGSKKITAAAEKRRHFEATLKCPFNECKATFTTRHNLQYHQNSHVGYKPYRCRKGCPYKASSPSTMKRHEKKCGPVQRAER